MKASVDAGDLGIDRVFAFDAPLPDAQNAVSMLVRLSIPDQPEYAKVIERMGIVPEPVYGGQLQDMAIPGVAPEGKVRVSVERLLTIPEARGRFARHLRLTLSGDPAAKPGAKQAVAQRLREQLAPFSPGNCPVRIVYSNGVARCELQLGDGYRVRLEDDLLGVLGDDTRRGLDDLFGLR